MEIRAAKMAQDFDDMIRMDEQRQPSKQPYNYMSSAGHECDRYLYYLRVEGDRREPPPVGLLKLFRQGREHERLAKADIMRMGYDWVEEQSAVEFEELELRGRHDGFVSRERDKVAAEIKSVSPMLFQKIAGMYSENLREDKYFSKHIAQFTGYLIGLEQEWGILIYRNRDNGDMKFFEIAVDPETWAEVANKFARINPHVASETPPDRVDGVGRDDVCGRCAFQHICLPDIRNELGGIAIIDAPDVEANIDRMKELEAAWKEYESLSRWRKERLKGIDGAVVGKYLVEGKMITRRGYTVDASEYWKTTIRTIPDMP